MRRLWKDKKVIARFQNVPDNKFPIIRSSTGLIMDGICEKSFRSF